jgi:hypothetical protein
MNSVLLCPPAAWRGFGDADPNVLSHNTDLEGIDTETGFRVVGPAAVRDAEPPGVPGAGDDGVLDIAAGEGGAHVRAGIGDGLISAVDVEHRNHPAVNAEGASFTCGDVADAGDCFEFCHVELIVYSSRDAVA